jgi:hypothetical protein
VFLDPQSTPPSVMFYWGWSSGWSRRADGLVV